MINVLNTIVNPVLIEKGWIGNFGGELFSQQGHLGPAIVGAEPALKYKPFFRTEAACASGGSQTMQVLFCCLVNHY